MGSLAVFTTTAAVPLVPLVPLVLLVCGFAFDAASPGTAQEFRPDAEGGWAVTADDPLSDDEKALLEVRLAAYEREPDAGSSWEEVETRTQSRLKALGGT